MGASAVSDTDNSTLMQVINASLLSMLQPTSLKWFNLLILKLKVQV